MSERIGVDIVAKDGASKVFQEVSRSADKMGAEIEQAGSRSSRAMAAMQANSRQIAASFGVIAAAGALAGKSFRDQEVALATLSRGYGDAANGLRQYANQIQDTTNYSNDAAIAAANVFRTLKDNYGFTADEIERLIAISADLAASHGVSLVDAARDVQSAMRGEAEAAEALGLTLNDHALGIDRLAASTSEAEKAQIRFNALQEQSAFAMGMAQEQAGGLYGELYSLKNELNDVVQGLAASNPMLAELGAFAADNAVEIAALTLAVGQLGSALKALGVFGAARGLGAGAMGIGGILGTGGVAAGGVLGGLGLVGWMLTHPESTGISEQIPFFEAFQQEAAKLDITLGNLAASGNEYAVETGQNAGQIVSDLTALAQRQNELLYKIENDQGASAAQTAAWWHELGLINSELGQQFADNSAYYLTGLATDINTIVGYTGDGAALMQEQLATLNDQFRSGWLSPSEYASQVDILANSVAYYDEQAQNGAKSTVEMGDAFRQTTGYAAAHAAGMERQAKLAEQIALAQEQLGHQFTLTTQQYRGTTDALASGFRVLVENTDAIAQQSQAVADWAENLIAAEGVYSKLDDLVIAGRITGESGQFEGASQYAAAQRAYNSILEDNAAIQEHILTIQAKQAPTIARLVDEQERYLAALSEAPAEQQMLALAYMDSATSAQALQLAQGYLADQDVFGPMIQQAAALDPYLAMILEDMGLIARDHEGNITLTGVEDSQSKLDALTTAIESLVQAQWIAMFGGDVTAAEAAYERATGLLVDWDNSEGTATISVLDNASGILAGVSSMLASLDGAEAVSYITTVRQEVLQTLSPFALGGVLGYANGGVLFEAAEAGPEMVSMANGGTALLPTHGIYMGQVGDYVHNAPATETGNWGSSALIGELHVHATGSDEEIAERVTRVIVPAIQRAMRQHVRASGGV